MSHNKFLTVESWNVRAIGTSVDDGSAAVSATIPVEAGLLHRHGSHMS